MFCSSLAASSSSLAGRFLRISDFGMLPKGWHPAEEPRESVEKETKEKLKGDWTNFATHPSGEDPTETVWEVRDRVQLQDGPCFCMFDLANPIDFSDQLDASYWPVSKLVSAKTENPLLAFGVLL